MSLSPSAFLNSAFFKPQRERPEWPASSFDEPFVTIGSGWAWAVALGTARLAKRIFPSIAKPAAARGSYE